MRCVKIREKFIDYVDDDVRFTERICVEVHVARCYACREELEELRGLQECLRQVVRHPGSDDRFDMLKGRIALHEAQRRSSGVWGAESWRNAATKLVAAAVVLIILGMSTPFVRQTKRLAASIQEATSQVEGPVMEVPLWSAPFVERKFDIEANYQNGDTLEETGPGSASRVPPKTPR